jgi:hypothetical protein
LLYRAIALLLFVAIQISVGTVAGSGVTGGVLGGAGGRSSWMGSSTGRISSSSEFFFPQVLKHIRLSTLAIKKTIFIRNVHYFDYPPPALYGKLFQLAKNLQ